MDLLKSFKRCIMDDFLDVTYSKNSCKYVRLAISFNAG